MPDQHDPAELKAFQADLKLKFRYLGSFLSIFMIIFGLYLLVNGLFNMVGVKSPEATPSEEELINDNLITDAGSVPTCPSPEAQRPGRINGEGVSTVRAQSFTAAEKAQQTAERIAKYGKWQATDYANGDIPAGSYSVQLGDTLWEIAEATYGSGFRWKEILNANTGKIGKLPDGSQALIFPGQVLSIPR